MLIEGHSTLPGGQEKSDLLGSLSFGRITLGNKRVMTFKVGAPGSGTNFQSIYLADASPLTSSQPLFRLILPSPASFPLSLSAQQDLLCCVMFMPQRIGYQCARLLLQSEQRTFVILLTGEGATQDSSPRNTSSFSPSSLPPPPSTPAFLLPGSPSLSVLPPFAPSSAGMTLFPSPQSHSILPTRQYLPSFAYQGPLFTPAPVSSSLPPFPSLVPSPSVAPSHSVASTTAAQATVHSPQQEWTPAVEQAGQHLLLADIVSRLERIEKGLATLHSPSPSAPTTTERHVRWEDKQGRGRERTKGQEDEGEEEEGDLQVSEELEEHEAEMTQGEEGEEEAAVPGRERALSEEEQRFLSEINDSTERKKNTTGNDAWRQWISGGTTAPYSPGLANLTARYERMLVRTPVGKPPSSSSLTPSRHAQPTASTPLRTSVSPISLSTPQRQPLAVPPRGLFFGGKVNYGSPFWARSPSPVATAATDLNRSVSPPLSPAPSQTPARKHMERSVRAEDKQMEEREREPEPEIENIPVATQEEEEIEPLQVTSDLQEQREGNEEEEDVVREEEEQEEEEEEFEVVVDEEQPHHNHYENDGPLLGSVRVENGYNYVQ